jgi:hypothetical protein
LVRGSVPHLKLVKELANDYHQVHCWELKSILDQHHHHKLSNSMLTDLILLLILLKL